MNIPTGNRNAEKPQNWENRSGRCAPTGPIQLRAWPETTGEATLKDASSGEYESRLKASRTAMLRPTNPIITLKRLFSVGERMRTTSPYPDERPAALVESTLF